MGRRRLHQPALHGPGVPGLRDVHLRGEVHRLALARGHGLDDLVPSVSGRGGIWEATRREKPTPGRLPHKKKARGGGILYVLLFLLLFVWGFSEPKGTPHPKKRASQTVGLGVAQSKTQRDKLTK